MINGDDYPYTATWAETLEEAEIRNEYGMDGWIIWNGVAGVWPNFVRYMGVTYTFEDFKKEVWKL